MWSDNETTEDLLGFNVHSDLLKDVINDDSLLPVTIGVFGDYKLTEVSRKTFVK